MNLAEIEAIVRAQLLPPHYRIENTNDLGQTYAFKPFVVILGADRLSWHETDDLARQAAWTHYDEGKIR